MIERLPERYKTAVTARAIMAPSAILLAGAGMSAAILGGVPIAAAALVGAAAWAARVALGLPRRAKGERIDPFGVGDPWRRFVQDALQAQARFDQTVRRARPGPLQERLTDVGRRIGEGVTDIWRIAQHGDALDGALRELDVQSIQRELHMLHAERRSTPKGSPAQAALERTTKAVEAQLSSAERIDRVASEARDRVRLLNAQLDEAVARAVELSLQANDVSDLSPLTADVDNLVSELEALRQAMEETGGSPGAVATG